MEELGHIYQQSPARAKLVSVVLDCMLLLYFAVRDAPQDDDMTPDW